MVNNSCHLQLQARDLGLFQDLLELRGMALRHIVLCHFQGHGEACRKRVHRLEKEGYLRRAKNPVRGPVVFCASSKAIGILKSAGLISASHRIAAGRRMRVGVPTTEHELQILDVRSSFVSAFQDFPAKLHLMEFTTQSAAYQFKARRNQYPGAPEVLVKPDAFFQIMDESKCYPKVYAFFLEVDRSTEPQKTLATKGICYVDYYRSGRYAKRAGRTTEEYRCCPFRVLMVLKNVERRNNTAQQLLQLQPPIHGQVWLTTLDEVLANPLGAIWVLPKEYLAVTRNTVFDVTHQRNGEVYRRQIEREIWVENKIKKVRLFEVAASET